MSLKIEIFKSESGTCKVELSGRLDTHTASEFDREMEGISFEEYKAVAIEISELDYVSSAGVRSLFKARKSAKEKDCGFVLVKPQPQVKKVFDIIKALPSETIFTSEQEMDKYLDAIQRKAR